MNMTYNKYNIEQSFTQLFEDRSIDDKYRRKALLIMARFLSEIEHIRRERRLKKKEIAKMLDVSPSYLSQLYSGDKLLNLETLAKFQEILDIRFDIKAVSNSAPLLVEKNKLQFLQKFYAQEGSGFWTYKPYKSHISKPIYSNQNKQDITLPNIDVAS